MQDVVAVQVHESHGNVCGHVEHCPIVETMRIDKAASIQAAAQAPGVTVLHHLHTCTSSTERTLCDPINDTEIRISTSLPVIMAFRAYDSPMPYL